MIVPPIKTTAPVPEIYSDTSKFLAMLDSVGPNWIDFETTGLDMKSPEFRAVGVGLANSKCPHGIYLPITDNLLQIVNVLYTHRLVAYNVGFDAKVLHRMSLDVGIEPARWPWIGDTLILWKLLDNRGFKGQTWGLKDAQKNVLGWTQTNEVELDDWLISNGHSRKAGGVLKPLKGEMWRAPIEILGHYCGLDAASTMMLDRYLSRCAAPFPELTALYEREFNTQAKLFNEQFWKGTVVDSGRLTAYIDNMNRKIKEASDKFLHSTEAAQYIREFNDAQHQAVLDSEPPKYLTSKTRIETDASAAAHGSWAHRVAVHSDLYQGEVYTEKGNYKRGYITYMNEFKLLNPAPTKEYTTVTAPNTNRISARWNKWLAKVEASEGTMYFNPSSKTQLRWLFYERLYRLEDVKHKRNWKGEYVTQVNTASKEKKAWNIYTAKLVDNSNDTEITLVEGKGYPDDEPTFSVDKNILPRMGEAGKTLFSYNKLIKELGYAQAVMDGLGEDDRISLGLRVHGAVTGRSSGGGYVGNSVNIQQQHKDPEYMACFVPPKGHKIIQWDASALENVILAELSGDANMYQLYGSGIPNDGHLFFGSRMAPLKEELTRYGYDPDNPQPAAIKETKSKAKAFRNIAKTVVYLCSYLGGAGTLRKSLENQGFNMTLKDCKALIKGYWDTIPEVTAYYERLKSEWVANQGWLLNARSRPMSVPPKMEKDLASRVIQSTGHDILLTVIYYIDKYRTERGVTMHPAITDLHDETIWYAPDDQVEAAKKVIEDALDKTNRELGAAIPISGGVEVTTDFIPFKCG